MVPGSKCYEEEVPWAKGHIGGVTTTGPGFPGKIR